MLIRPADNISRHKQFVGLLLIMAAGFALTGCMPPPSRYATVPIRTTAQPPPPPTEVFFYPNRGQSPEQQDRDSYECYLWAVNQTGFDPSATNLAPHQKVTVIAEPPPGTDTAAGAITGAMLGAAVSSRGNMVEGALVGMMAGAIFGSASDAARQEQTYRLQDHYDRQASQHTATIERQAEEYRRALSACLEGRGYTVR